MGEKRTSPPLVICERLFCRFLGVGFRSVQGQHRQGFRRAAGNVGGQLAVPVVHLGELDQVFGQALGDLLVSFGFGFGLYLGGVGFRVGVDLHHLGLGVGFDLLALGLLLGFHGLLLLLDFGLQLTLGGYLLGFNGVGEGVGKVDVFNGYGDDGNAVALHFTAQVVADLDGQLLPGADQVFGGVLGEHGLGVFQHAGIHQLAEILGANFLEQRHGRGLIDGVVDGAHDVHLLDIAGKRLGGEGGLLLPVVHQNDFLEGALHVETGFQGVIFHLAEGGHDGGVAGIDLHGAAEKDDQRRQNNDHRQHQRFRALGAGRFPGVDGRGELRHGLFLLVFLGNARPFRRRSLFLVTDTV